jgi:hypothetical protein
MKTSGMAAITPRRVRLRPFGMSALSDSFLIQG